MTLDFRHNMAEFTYFEPLPVSANSWRPLIGSAAQRGGACAINEHLGVDLYMMPAESGACSPMRYESQVRFVRLSF